LAALSGRSELSITRVHKDYHSFLRSIEKRSKLSTKAQSAADHQVTALECESDRPTRVKRFNGITPFDVGRITTAASMPLSLSQPVALARRKLNIIHGHSQRPLGLSASDQAHGSRE
jgi:hypothetical protein